ncbi:Metalloprotease PmbA [termite gut metagenome]|uniref:Metalloprotease PmbA n=1 Tax=termite gut metagenome TaxID=433724 RepID=A0A5J4QTB1_9ZZZZ
MIGDSNKQLAQQVMDFALKNGCQAARVTLYSGSNTSFEWRDGKIDKLQQASENELSISLYVNGRYGNYSTNRLERREVEAFIRNGIDATRYLVADEARTLPDPQRYYQGGKPDLQLFDATLATISPDDKAALAKIAGEEALGKDNRIVSVQSSYDDGMAFNYCLTSNGFEGETGKSWCSLSVSVSIKGEGDARPSDYWYDSSLYFDKLIKEGIGKKALERVFRKLGQRKVHSGKYTLVVDSMNSGRLLSPMVGALSGAALQQKNSFLLDQLHQKTGSNRFTLTDNPHIPQASGARYFDQEGVATQPRSIFENGVLNTYFIDTYHAKKLNIAPTIGSPSILTLQTGVKELEGLIAGVDKGILVTGFNGGNCNSSTGDFSYGMEGFLIEKGELTIPVSEMNLTGNMFTLWRSLVETGNDPRLSSSWRIPSLVFEGVDFNGM